MNIWEKLPKPFFALAPMDDVTDTVFRQIIAGCAPPDLFFTEFVNVDGLQSLGRPNLLKKLQFTSKEKPIIAQIWGKKPENYYKTAQEMVAMGFDGVDLNFGCPDKTVIKNGCGIALINNRPLATEIIAAVKAGVNGRLPVSVKTRLGLKEIDLSWHEFLLSQKLGALTIHGRTAKHMSDVPANWDLIGQIREMRDNLSPNTKIIGNGDVTSTVQGSTLYSRYGVDGIMIGRGVFADPFVFAKDGSRKWEKYGKAEKIALYCRHVELFAATWQNNERKPHTLNKFCKIYIQGFDGAKEMREKLMVAETTDDLLKILKHLL